MSKNIHPNKALFEGEKPFPIIPTCEHFAGSEKLITKALRAPSHATLPNNSLLLGMSMRVSFLSCSGAMAHLGPEHRSGL